MSQVTKNLDNIDETQIEYHRKQENQFHYLIESEDGISLFLRKWEASTPNGTCILILHGITAHSKPYEVMATPLTNNGFDVLGLDLRGHGLSDGNRGDYESEDQVISDLELVLDFISTELNYLNIIVLGHSLGVLTSLKILQNEIGTINGIALFSAARKSRKGIRKEPSFLQKLKILFYSFLMPGKPIITYYRDGMKGLDDPLFNFKYTLRFFKIFDANTVEYPIEIDYPLFFAIGENDELFTIESAKELFEDIQSPDKTFYVMENSKHAEFADDAFDEFIEWLKSRFVDD